MKGLWFSVLITCSISIVFTKKKKKPNQNWGLHGITTFHSSRKITLEAGKGTKGFYFCLIMIIQTNFFWSNQFSFYSLETEPHTNESESGSGSWKFLDISVVKLRYIMPLKKILKNSTTGRKWRNVSAEKGITQNLFQQIPCYIFIAAIWKVKESIS